MGTPIKKHTGGSLNLVQTLLDFGRTHNLVQVRRAETTASVETLRADTNRVALDVQQAYLQALRLRGVNQRMRVDILPDLGVPVIYVAQPYGGMDPAQVEGYITYYYEYHFLTLRSTTQVWLSSGHRCWVFGVRYSVFGSVRSQYRIPNTEYPQKLACVWMPNVFGWG